MGRKRRGTDQGIAGARRRAAVTLKFAKGRSPSSGRWLRRQLKDPFVDSAQRLGYRSRAAFKLIQLDDRFHLLRPGARVVDLGAAPGGWTQVAVERVKGGRVVSVDAAAMDPVPGAVLLRIDASGADAVAAIRATLDGPADLVMSDMSAPATGHGPTDHLRVAALAEAAYAIARRLLAPGGAFLAKVLRGGAERALLDSLKRDFALVRHAKPPASRKESRELYVIATGFRGPQSGER
ncbi:MAG: RlmE family RNA methyltransferase [Kiloniellales bacterium]